MLANPFNPLRCPNCDSDRLGEIEEAQTCCLDCNEEFTWLCAAPDLNRWLTAFEGLMLAVEWEMFA